jgi:hypothetical protein
MFQASLFWEIKFIQLTAVVACDLRHIKFASVKSYD